MSDKIFTPPSHLDPFEDKVEIEISKLYKKLSETTENIHRNAIVFQISNLNLELGNIIHAVEILTLVKTEVTKPAIYKKVEKICQNYFVSWNEMIRYFQSERYIEIRELCEKSYEFITSNQK